MNLSKALIDEFGMKSNSYRSDKGDISIDYILPCGIVLTGYIVLSNKPTETDCLEGLDGFICITSKEELENLHKMTLDEIIDWVASKNEEFDRTEYE